MIRCLVLSRYGLLGASSRIRFSAYFGGLKQQGIECELSPLLDDQYLRARYANRQERYQQAARGYLKRLWMLMDVRRYDVVWIEKEVFPWLPGIYERLITDRCVPYVVDYDDAIFLNYDRLNRGGMKYLYNKKFSRLLQRASAITVGNSFLGRLARENGARDVVQLPSVVDLTRYPIKTEALASEEKGVLTIGWIGTPMTMHYLRVVEAPLAKLAKTQPIRLMTVGAEPLGDFDVPLVQHAWSLETEVELIGQMNVGIMPLFDTPWERGKCGYKLIQYMAAGKPVVASPVGANQDIVSHGVNGYLAADAESWHHALTNLVDSASLRSSMGEAGRTRVARHYSVQATLPLVAQVLKDAVAGKGP